MGCYEAKPRQPGLITPIDKKAFDKLYAERSFITLDCSKQGGEDLFIKNKLKGDSKYLNLSEFFENDRLVRRFEEKLAKRLEEFHIGMETNVVTYDNDDGMAACLGAYMVSSIGVRFVQVFSCKIAERDPPAIHTITERDLFGTEFDFKFKEPLTVD
jgi:hypothetical protein